MASKNHEVLSVTSTKADGSMSNNHQLQVHNIRKFLELNAIPFSEVHFMNQVHGNTVAYVDKSSPQKIDAVDGLITDKPNTFLAVVTADCIPVTIIDRESNIIAVAHAGYKGLLAGVLQNILTEAKKRGANTKSMEVSLGASIGSCCYDIDTRRAAEFEEHFFGDDIFRYSGDKIYLSLSKVAQNILTTEGLPAENITTSQDCTRCNNDRYFSFRGDSAETFGTFVTIVGIKKSV